MNLLRMFKPAKHSLRIKFSLTAAVILLVIFTLASIIRIIQTTNFQKQSLLARAETFAELATKPLGDAYTLYHDSGVLKLNDIFRQTLQLNTTVPRIEVISVNGEVLFDSNNMENIESETSGKKQVTITNQTLLQAIVNNEVTQIKGENGDVTEIIVPYSDSFGSRPFSLRYFISYDSINESVTQAVITTAILNIILFLIALATITYLVNRSILSPLSKITKAAQAIGHGDLKQDIIITTRDELADLAISLNLMTTTLKNNIFDLKKTDQLKDEFITIASHNLRTPLTVIKGYIPSLKDKTQDADSLGIIDIIDKSVRKLDTLTESLLNIVAFERRGQTLTKDVEDINEILHAIVDIYSKEASQKHITFSLHLPEQPVKVSIDKIKMRQAISHIIDNAVKFNKENGVITVDLTTLNNEVMLSVSDTGIGISSDELKNIFQRFHRGTDVLTYDYEGLGLGLYLCKMIIEAHGGTIRMTSKLQEGTSVFISLPIGS